MSETHASTEDHHEPGRYEIRLKGHLDDRWADWFEGLTITREDNGETLLNRPGGRSGRVAWLAEESA